MIRRTFVTSAPAANSLIRLMVGGIFILLITGAGPWSADAKLSRP
jgi:uncharacterized membrane protein YphA (DoxX/SURF4 family)